MGRTRNWIELSMGFFCKFEKDIESTLSDINDDFESELTFDDEFRRNFIENILKRY